MLEAAGHKDIDLVKLQASLNDPAKAEKIRQALTKANEEVGKKLGDSATFYALANPKPQPTKTVADNMVGIQDKYTPRAGRAAERAANKAFTDYSWGDIAESPIQFGADVARGMLVESPKILYGVGRDLLKVPASAAGAGIKMMTRPTDVNNPSFMQEAEKIQKSDSDLLNFVTDPLMLASGPIVKGLSYGPRLVAKAGSSMLGKIPKAGPAVAKSIEAATKPLDWIESVMLKQPAQTARDVEALVDPARKLSEVRRSEAAATKYAKDHPYAPIPDPLVEGLPHSTILPEQLEQWLGKTASAQRAIDKMSPLQRRLVEALGKPNIVTDATRRVLTSNPGKAGVAGAHGAAQGVGYDYLSRYLNDQEAPDAESLAWSAGLGGVLGGLGSFAQERGIENFPGMYTQALKIDDAARENIKENLPRIISEGFIPKSSVEYQKMVEEKLAELAPRYQQATAAVSRNFAGSLDEYLVKNPSRFGSGQPAVDNLTARILGEIDDRLKLPTRRIDANHVQIGEVEMHPNKKLQARKAAKDVIAGELPNYEQADRIRNAVNKAVNEAEMSGDIAGLLTDKSGPLVRLLDAPEHPISISRMEQRMRSMLDRNLRDSRESLRYDVDDEGVVKLMQPMEADIAGKIKAMKTKSQAHNNRGVPYEEVDELSPFEVAELRTSLTDPKVYEDPNNRALFAQAKMTNRAFRDAITDELMGIDKYRQALGPKTAQEYALWRQLGTLAEHPGRTRLASRFSLPLYQPSVDVFRMPSAQFKAGNLLQFVGEKSPIARAAWRDSSKTKSDSSKTKK